jgi:hypothetical protein
VALHVELWQFDSYGETLDDENDTGELEGDSIPQIVATVASPMYSFSLMNDEHNMNRLVKPPRMM